MNRPATLAQKSRYSRVYIRNVCQPMSTCSDGPRPGTYGVPVSLLNTS
ncbi:hypothetical protein OG884_22620 [Streptosporangium sp. NBC_01755]|nr:MULTISPECIES: hypothetical protein [unclassified Streptosporangium]WSA24242.1 hypothetical protein OIE13_25300 [Streptosporangium sp. NBC_01810]WSC97683.1 hypothetical protein OG884_22620 [Streptosporangium sp. NBC_01755]